MRLAFLLLLASVSVVLFYARGIAALFRRETAEDALSGEQVPADPESDGPREGQAAVVFLTLGVGLILLLGVFPQILLPAVTRAAEAFVR